MSTSTAIRVESRILSEGYGPGAWHGADLKAALADVTPEAAYWRPSAGRHNIAEIALHHAFCVRSVGSRLSARPAEPFVLPGEDWFDLAGESTLAWSRVLSVVETEQERLARLVGDVEAGTITPAVTDEERLSLVLGITCHAVYHAGQIQLIKRLRGE
jgi:hypothetical protein